MMNKRVLCFFSAVVLALMLLPASVLACDHCDEDGNPLKYVVKGAVSPEIGKAGFSGDYCCPECGAVVISGWTLPALEEPSESSGDKKPGNKPEQAATPKTTTKPTAAPKTGPTVAPKRTAAPAPALKPTEIPKVPDSPGKTEKPKQTTKPGKTGQSGGTGKQDENHSEEGTVRWEWFSQRYPYRRMRMEPMEGIRAEGAGILLWPAAASPFQSIFGSP